MFVCLFYVDIDIIYTGHLYDLFIILIKFFFLFVLEGYVCVYIYIYLCYICMKVENYIEFKYGLFILFLINELKKTLIFTCNQLSFVGEESNRINITK